MVGLLGAGAAPEIRAEALDALGTALQEAGLVGVTPLAGFPRSELVGLYPTLETLAAQLATALLLAAGFYRANRPAAIA